MKIPSLFSMFPFSSAKGDHSDALASGAGDAFQSILEQITDGQAGAQSESGNKDKGVAEVRSRNATPVAREDVSQQNLIAVDPALIANLFSQLQEPVGAREDGQRSGFKESGAVVHSRAGEPLSRALENSQAGEALSSYAREAAMLELDIAAGPQQLASSVADAFEQAGSPKVFAAPNGKNSSNADAGKLKIAATRDDRFVGVDTNSVAKVIEQSLAIDVAKVRKADTATLDVAVDDMVGASFDAHVEVVEEKNYPAPAYGSISAQIANAIRDSSVAVEQPAAEAKSTKAVTPALNMPSALAPARAITLDLKPEHLGAVRLTIHLSGDHISVKIDVEKSHAVASVIESQDALDALLKQSGMQSCAISVGVLQTDGARSDAQPQGFSGESSGNTRGDSRESRPRQERERRQADEGSFSTRSPVRSHKSGRGYSL